MTWWSYWLRKGKQTFQVTGISLPRDWRVHWPTGTFEIVDNLRSMEEKADRSSMALRDSHDYSYKEISCITRMKTHYWSISPLYGKTPWNFGNPKYQISSTRKDPYFERIPICHLSLYKHQTFYFLKYVENL